MLALSLRRAGCRLFSSTVSVPVPSAAPAMALALEGMPERGPAVAPDTSARVSQLKNGLRVASLDKHEGVSRVTVALNVGARDESATSSGLAHLYSRLALRSSAERSEFRFVREMERIGSSAAVVVTRENVLVEVDSLRENVGATLRLVADALQRPKFKASELVEAKSLVKYDVAEYLCSTEKRVLDALYNVSFDGTTLGMPVVSTAGASFSSDKLQAFVSRSFNPSDVIISGVNVDHQDLLDAAEETFGGLSGSSVARERTDAVFLSGVDSKAVDLTVDCGVGFAVGFSAPAFASRQSEAAQVLQTLLGSGSSSYQASVGGGASLLSTNVVGKVEGVTRASAFYHPFSDIGVFGVYVESSPESAEAAAHAVVAQIKEAGSLSDADVARAKNALKGQLLAAREGRGSQAENVVNWLFTEGSYPSVDSMLKRVDSVTAAEVKSVAASLLQQKPNLAAVGDISFLPGTRKLWS